MGSPDLSQMHTTYLLNSISRSPYPTPCPPLYLPPHHYFVLVSPGWLGCSLNIKCSFVTYVTQDGIWTAFSHPSPPSQLGPEIIPYLPLTTPYPRQQHDTFATPPQSWILNLIKMKIYPTIIKPHHWNTHYHLPITNCHWNLPTWTSAQHRPMI